MTSGITQSELLYKEVLECGDDPLSIVSSILEELIVKIEEKETKKRKKKKKKTTREYTGMAHFLQLINDIPDTDSLQDPLDTEDSQAGMSSKKGTDLSLARAQNDKV